MLVLLERQKDLTIVMPLRLLIEIGCTHFTSWLKLIWRGLGLERLNINLRRRLCIIWLRILLSSRSIKELPELRAAVTPHLGGAVPKKTLVATTRSLASTDSHVMNLTETDWSESMLVFCGLVDICWRNSLDESTLVHQGLRLRLFHQFKELKINFVSLKQLWLVGLIVALTNLGKYVVFDVGRAEPCWIVWSCWQFICFAYILGVNRHETMILSFAIARPLAKWVAK